MELSKPFSLGDIEHFKSMNCERQDQEANIHFLGLTPLIAGL